LCKRKRVASKHEGILTVVSDETYFSCPYASIHAEISAYVISPFMNN
jgi:hypothetical protein